MQKKWHRYRYKNITYLILSIIVAYVLFKNTTFHEFLTHLGTYGYVGAFMGGILFSSTFTISIGAVILLNMIEYLNPWEIALIAGVGGVMGDALIFQFIRNKGLVDEIKHFVSYFGADKLGHLLHTKYFSWTLPVFGALIIASPLPDELGVSLIGISRMTTLQFIVISFIMNTIGIFIILSASIWVKP